MSYKKTILTGTLLLTLSGLISRILGFYNRIFLADRIGAKELGIYSLIFPVYALCFTLVCQGFEAGISNMTSRFLASGQKKAAGKLLAFACLLSTGLALFLSLVLIKTSGYLSKYLLNEPSCASSLRIAALALPFAALKACIHGYYIGHGRSAVSAASQLIEQCSRVGGIYLLSIYLYSACADASLAVWGMVLGEIVSCLYTLLAYGWTRIKGFREDRSLHTSNIALKNIAKEFLSFTMPLTINRFSMTLVSGLEAILIPVMLSSYFGNHDQALHSYGALTGMAFPFLFLPATITNSVSVMLLPAISAAWEQKKMAVIRHTISKSLHYCIVIGMISSFAFLFYGQLLAETVFHNQEAGYDIYSFAVICPFLYASSTLMSILNGFGLTKKTMYHNLLGVAVRIAFILLAVPVIGIKGYCYGMLAGLILQLLLDLFSLLGITFFDFSVERTLLLPAAAALSGGWLSLKVYDRLTESAGLPPQLILAISGSIFALISLLSVFGPGSQLLKKDQPHQLMGKSHS